MTPKVSVIVTLYNYSKYIGECISTFIQQDFVEAEMVIVDDGSTDNPFPVIKEAAGKDNRVRYIRLNQNTNYSNAKNVGVKASDAELLVMLDADDMLTQQGITVRYNKLQEGYDLVHGPCLQMQGSKSTRDLMWGKWEKTKDPMWIHAQGVMLRKDIHRRIGLYDIETWAQPVSDREMFCRVASNKYKIGSVDVDVAVYRMHEKQMHKKEKKRSDRAQIFQRLEEVKIRREKGNFTGLEMLV